MSVDVAVTGATGRMGRAVIEAASDREDVAVAFAVARSGAPGDRAGTNGAGGEKAVGDVTVEAASDLDRLLAERDPDALVDFTGPESSVEYVAAAAEAGVASVVGTTGFDDEGERALRESAERAPVLKASNFGRGVQALLSAVESAVADLPGYDAEVTETHHNRKRDAPSGTAKTILTTIEDAREDTAERVHGREGDAPRRSGEIGVHARRAGSITGEHEVLLAGNHEEVRLTHRAEDRGVFAEGALDAAVRLAGRDPGRYEFADVVGAGATEETTDEREATDDERGGSDR